MTETDLVVKDALEAQVPLRLERQPAWDDVLRRAGIDRVEAAPVTEAPRKETSRRRLTLALVLALALLAVAGASPLGPALAGLGRNALDGLGSWLRGDPGRPAPAEEQKGFAARNAAAYAAFPPNTRLRLLQRTTLAGRTFSLLGFRSRSSLCLRLVRSDRPGARGSNPCVTLSELRSTAAPALVASEAYFQVGAPATTVEGIFGFADDTVRRIEFRRAAAGWSSAPVASNVFLALRARRTGTVKNHPPLDPILQVRAVTASGRRVPIPFVASDFADYGHGLPTGPSYLAPRRVRNADLPGPVRVEAPFRGGTIEWLQEQEPRGKPWLPDPEVVARWGSLVHSRAIRPDPESPLRIGVFAIRTGGGALVLCESELRPLGSGATGASCGRPEAGSLFRPGQPVTTTWFGPEQMTEVTGLAADEVAEVDLFLSTGRAVRAALASNAYVVTAPTAELPGKLVAYDRRHRALGIELLPGPLRPTPCPQATFAKPVSALPPPRPYERLDLGERTVNGARIFGRAPAEILAALGRPDRVAHFSNTNGHPEPTFFYGGSTQSDVALLVTFGWRKHRMRAVGLWFQGPNLVEAKLGRVLRVQPLTLERRIESAYGSTYRLEGGYGAVPAVGCSAAFANRAKTVQLVLGIDPHRPSRPFLSIRHGY